MSEVLAKIREEISRRGPISFRRFMELALYCPVCGYYEMEEDRIGGAGDFYTSVTVGPLFGELLAWQFAAWLDRLTPRDPETCSGSPPRSQLSIVEAGSHGGLLANDILNWLQRHRPGLFEQLSYRIVEPSLRRQEWQRHRLARWGTKVSWVPELQSLCGPGQLTGVIFGNELLDSFPVHRLAWDRARHEWFEWGVCLTEKGLDWCRLEVPEASPDSLSASLPEGLLALLPDHYTVEFNPAATEWWKSAASTLGQGWLLTFDYGLETDEWFHPGRAQGTLRAYRGHRVSHDLLADPGQQDLTAHVNFTTLRLAGESAGLLTASLQSQEAFLTGIMRRACRPESGLEPWTPSRIRQFKTLTHPDHLGRSFRVLAQHTHGLES